MVSPVCFGQAYKFILYGRPAHCNQVVRKCFRKLRDVEASNTSAKLFCGRLANLLLGSFASDGGCSAAKLLTKDEARRIAANIAAKLKDEELRNVD
jgi:hypothetical protein